MLTVGPFPLVAAIALEGHYPKSSRPARAPLAFMASPSCPASASAGFSLPETDRVPEEAAQMSLRDEQGPHSTNSGRIAAVAKASSLGLVQRTG